MNQLESNMSYSPSSKEIIIGLFMTNVYGKKTPQVVTSHDGIDGHWLEKQMECKPNGKNEPDIEGFEMKNTTKSKITFVDKQTTAKFFEGKKFTTRDKKTKQDYWNTFARTNSQDIRIGGWKLDEYDIDGQCLKIDDNNNINVIYNYHYDKRSDKKERVPEYYKNEKDNIIATWSKKDLEKCINNKWNQEGFFICQKDKITGIYNKICFGNPITFEYWIDQVKKKQIIYDGYSTIFGRWRGVFRASNSWWNQHITEEY